MVVRETALLHPMTGYKRLTYLLQNDAIAGVRAHQVYDFLKSESLIRTRPAFGPLELRRPEPPGYPNQVWHVDIMYLHLKKRWWYLVDIIDGYSRYLVHWTLNPTMLTDTVTLTILEALEMWEPEKPPVIVHDSGSQFVSKDWKQFAAHHGLPDVRTRVAHPQSNGRLERLHRTHREEGVLGAAEWDSDQAKAMLQKWNVTYNDLRPHLALKGLPPTVYYLGEPQAALAQREHYVLSQAKIRADYWRQNQA